MGDFDFTKKDRALEYLQAQNQQRMAGIPEDLQEMLQGLDPDKAAAWLDQHGDKYRSAAQGGQGGQPVLSDEQKRIVRLSHMTEEEYLEIMKEQLPDAYQEALQRGQAMAAAGGQTEPEIQLSDSQRETLKKMGMTEAEYVQSLKDVGYTPPGAGEND